MPSNQDPHVVYRGNKNWAVRKENNQRDSFSGLGRSQAKKKANDVADKDGTNPHYHDKKGKFSKD